MRGTTTQLTRWASSTLRRDAGRRLGLLLSALTGIAVVVAGCADEAPGACDPRELACRELIAAEILRVRGGPPVTLPPVEVVTEDELRARLEQDAVSLTPEEAALFEKWGRGLMLLRLVSSPDAVTRGSIDDFVMSVWGYYDRETGQITLIERPQSADPDTATWLFAHELTHHAQALDLQAGFATQAGLNGSIDTQDALSHHSEGEAVVVSELVRAELRGSRFGFEDARTYFARWLLATQQEVADSRDPYLVVRARMKYPVGGAYLSEVRFDHGNDALRTQWVPPVSTTASWMRGYEAVEEVEALEDCELPITPTSYMGIVDERLGGELLFAMLIPEGVRDEASLARSWAAATHWRSDHVRVFVDVTVPPASAPVAVAYRVRLDSEDAAAEVEALFDDSLGNAGTVSRMARDVLVLLAEDPAVWSSPAFPSCDQTLRRASSATRMPPVPGLPAVDVTWRPSASSSVSPDVSSAAE